MCIQTRTLLENKEVGKTRIISDYYEKGEKKLWDPKESDSSYNRKLLAVNRMYGWLYEKGILQKVSFLTRNYSDAFIFVFDCEEMLPYRQEMESSGIEDATLAVQHIFDEAYTPCLFSGTIQLGWPMTTYRNVDGCVGRSWENHVVIGLSTREAYDVYDVWKEKGPKEAAKVMFDLYGWKPESDIAP